MALGALLLLDGSDLNIVAVSQFGEGIPGFDFGMTATGTNLGTNGISSSPPFASAVNAQITNANTNNLCVAPAAARFPSPPAGRSVCIPV
jgi:hypothetical protein